MVDSLRSVRRVEGRREGRGTDHFLPNDGCLVRLQNRAVGAVDKMVQRVVERPAILGEVTLRFWVFPLLSQPRADTRAHTPRRTQTQCNAQRATRDDASQRPTMHRSPSSSPPTPTYALLTTPTSARTSPVVHATVASLA